MPILYVSDEDIPLRALVTHGCDLPPGKMVRRSLKLRNGQVVIIEDDVIPYKELPESMRGVKFEKQWAAALALTQPCPSGQEPSRRTDSSPVSPAVEPLREDA